MGSSRTSRVRSLLPTRVRVPGSIGRHFAQPAGRNGRRHQEGALARRVSQASRDPAQQHADRDREIRGLRQCKAGLLRAQRRSNADTAPPSLLRLPRPRATAQAPKEEEAVKLPRDESPLGRALVAVRPLPCHAATFPSSACQRAGRNKARPALGTSTHAGRAAREGIVMSLPPRERAPRQRQGMKRSCWVPVSVWGQIVRPHLPWPMGRFLSGGPSGIVCAGPRCHALRIYACSMPIEPPA
jgi:hypothetical protein